MCNSLLGIEEKRTEHRNQRERYHERGQHAHDRRDRNRRE